MKHVFAVCTILVLAGAAAAQVADPDDNSSGIYFAEDASAGTWCTDAATGSILTAYLCLTNATDISGFIYWEGRLDISSGGSFTGFTIRGDGTNASSAPDFMVTYGTPLPYHASDSTVILEMDVLVQSKYTIAMRWWPANSPSGSDPLPTYKTVAAPDTYVSLGYSNGWNQGTGVPNWCASINDLNCLESPSTPVREISWSEVKTLYR